MDEFQDKKTNATQGQSIQTSKAQTKNTSTLGETSQTMQNEKRRNQKSKG